MAYLCAAGKRLRYEINVLWPERDTASDGWAASASHHAINPNSDHDPDPTSKPAGIVRAIDIDEDLLGRDGQDPKAANLLANQIVLKAQAGDDRIKYVIFEGRIASAKSGWKWRDFTGYSHPRHLHVSFTTAGDNDRRSFHLTK
jgi:hypothetical protein